MKNAFLSLAAISSLLSSFSVLSYDAQTNLAARIQDGSVATQVHEQYTANDGTFDQSGYDTNMSILSTKYLSAYLCVSGKDVSQCGTPMQN